MVTIAELKARTQRQKMNKRFLLAFGYTIHRKISVYITWLLVNAFPKIKPQYVGFSMVVSGIAGAYVLLFYGHSFMWGVLGFTLVYVSFLLDKVDGEVARFKEIYNARGVYLDEIYHILVPGALLFGVFYVLAAQSSIILVELFIAIWFTTLNRYNRKSLHMIFVKLTKRLEAKELEHYRGSRIVKAVFNNILFKFTSIPERFDVVLITLFSAYAVDFWYETNVLYYYLVVYSALVVLQFLRWTLLNYFGHADSEIERMSSEGY